MTDLVLYSPRSVMMKQPPQDKTRHTYSEEFVEYTVIEPRNIRDHITEYLGRVLANCWINPHMLAELEQEPHRVLREMGIILPSDMQLEVHRSRGRNRPKLVLFETDAASRVRHRVCYLQLSMLAGR